jgi:hypothetical protein
LFTIDPRGESPFGSGIISRAFMAGYLTCLSLLRVPEKGALSIGAVAAQGSGASADHTLQGSSDDCSV